jgi:hypothetical protein
VSACEGKCDCGAPGGYPHDPDCRSLDECGENGMCEKHWQEELYAHGWMKGREPPRSQEEIDQELRDSGHDHLIGLEDRIDYARMRAKEGL